MNIIFYDLIFFVIALIFSVIFLYKNKKNIKKEGVFVLYRTKFGIKTIEKVSKKRFLSFFEKPIITLGYFLMIGGLFTLIRITYFFIKIPKEFVEITKVPPVMPLIPYFTSLFKVEWLPPFYFTYWIIIVAITTISHEFLHGVFFRKADVKIKSTGFAFLGPFLAAFVEPDEKEMKKKEKKELAALAAGSVGNFMIAIIFLLVMWLFFNLFFVESGVRFDNYAFTIINTSSITNISDEVISINGENLTKIFVGDKGYFVSLDYLQKNKNQEKIFVFEDSPALKNKIKGAIIEIDGKKIKNIEDFQKVIKDYKPKDTIILKTEFNNTIESYNITLSSQENSSQPYLGIVILKEENAFRKIWGKILFFKKEGTYYKPKLNSSLTLFFYNLLWWAFLINLGVALFNMIPATIFDGGKFFYITILKITKSKKISDISFKISSFIILLLLLTIMIIWFFNFF